MTRTPNDSDVNYAARRRDAAHWYAWGALDALAIHNPDAADTIRRGAALLDFSRGGDPGPTFAEMARREAIAYRTDETGSLSSVTDQWSRFVAMCTPPVVIPEPPAETVAFFRQHAGFSYDPATETPDQGRDRCARDLAIAEARAITDGLAVRWEDDWSVGDHTVEFDCYDDGPPDTCELATLTTLLDPSVILAALGCVDDATSEYRRVVGAELAAEHYAEIDPS